MYALRSPEDSPERSALPSLPANPLPVSALQPSSPSPPPVDPQAEVPEQKIKSILKKKTRPKNDTVPSTRLLDHLYPSSPRYEEEIDEPLETKRRGKPRKVASDNRRTRRKKMKW